MGTVIVDITMSLDGFVTGPDAPPVFAMPPIRLVQEDVTASPAATHLTYRVDHV